MLHISINIIPQDFLQYQCEQIINYFGLQTVMNDYNANPYVGPKQTNAVHDLFTIPFEKPRFIVINCVSNSSDTPPYQLMLTENAGIGDFSPDGPAVARWRAAIDSVQAPLPAITSAALGPSAFRFVFPGQRGRTNQVLRSSDLLNWTVVTNVTGTNASVVFRDTNVFSNPGRAYRIRRL